jgi:predicted dehydrogenase
MSQSRRRFLEDAMFAAAATAAASAVPAWAEEAKQSASPNERLNVAVVGVNGRGGEHISEWLRRKDVLISHLCDVDSVVGNRRAEEIAKKQDHKPIVVEDIRKLLEDKTLHAVSIATPNHWHSLGAIWALQAGKDVYVEKPVSHNVSEGRRVVDAARKYNQICQTGTQRRSTPGTIDAIEFVKSGKIGDVKVARGLCYKPRGSIGAKGEYEIPKNINYDLWSGPARILPLQRPKLHYDWHWIWEYGNGDLGNQGIHQMDIARWGLGVNELSKGVLSYGGRFSYVDAGETANTQVVVHDYGTKSLVFEVRGLKTDDHKGAKVGVIFEGTEGYVVMTTYDSGSAFDKDGNKIKDFKGGGNHFGNFVTAVRSRKSTDLNADILEGHLSSALCHTGNISYRLGTKVSWADAAKQLDSVKTTDNAKETFERTMAHLQANKVDLAAEQVQFGATLVCDPKTETFPGNEPANKQLTREYRAPYVVPNAVNV